MTLIPVSYARGIVNHTISLRLPDGRELELYWVPGGAPGLRSVAVWRAAGKALGAVTAAQA